MPLGTLVVLACALAAAALSYWTALDAALVFDNEPILLEDPRIQKWEWIRVRDMLLGEYCFGRGSNLYRPLTTLSYALNYSLFGNGTDGTGYVVLNVLIHALNGLLVIALVRAVNWSRAAALVAGLIFVVHPVATEAVTNVVGRADLLAATGVLAGVLLHSRIVRAGRFRIAWSVGLMAASTVAIASKESGIVLIGVLLLHDLVLGTSHDASQPRLGALVRERLLRSYSWCLLPVAGYLVLRSIAVPGAASSAPVSDNPLFALDPMSARWSAAGVLVRYLGLILWPARLSVDYSYDSIPLFDGALRSATDWIHLLSAAFLVAAIGIAIAFRRRAPAVSFFVLFFFVTIAPVSNCFVLIGTIMAERLLYLPSVGPIVLLSGAMVGIGAAYGRGRPKAYAALPAIALIGVPLVGLAYRTATRNLDWRSGVALFSSAVRVNPGSNKANKALAATLHSSARDDEELRSRIDAILEHAEAACRILKQLPPDLELSNLRSDLALYYRTKARFAPASEAPTWNSRAENAYLDAIAEEAPSGPKRNWRLHLGLSNLLRDLGRRDEALVRFGSALELAPGPEVLAPYAALLSESGRDSEALLCALRLITLQPAHEGMWKIVSEYYARKFPGELTVTQSDGRWVFNTRHPAVASDLDRAVRQQYEASMNLGPNRGGAEYRRFVIGTLGIDPAPDGAQ